MIRYRLCTLLILLAVCAAVFARIGYLKRTAAMHRREANRLMAVIRLSDGRNEKQTNAILQELVEGGTAPWFAYERDDRNAIYLGCNGGSAFPMRDKGMAITWKACVVHQLLAGRYEHAIYRPWQFVYDNTDPGEIVAETTDR